MRTEQSLQTNEKKTTDVLKWVDGLRNVKRIYQSRSAELFEKLWRDEIWRKQQAGNTIPPFRIQTEETVFQKLLFVVLFSLYLSMLLCWISTSREKLNWIGLFVVSICKRKLKKDRAYLRFSGRIQFGLYLSKFLLIAGNSCSSLLWTPRRRQPNSSP